jgi:hypothetical protein
LSESILTTVIAFFTGSMTITYTAASITELTDGQSWFIETFVKLEKPQSCCGLPFMQLCLLFTCAVHFIKLDGLANVQLRAGWQRFSDRASGKAARHGHTGLAAAEDACLRARRPSWPAGLLPQGGESTPFAAGLLSLARSPGRHAHRNERISPQHAFFHGGRTGLTPIRVTSPLTVSRDQIPCRARPPGPLWRLDGARVFRINFVHRLIDFNRLLIFVFYICLHTLRFRRFTRST